MALDHLIDETGHPFGGGGPRQHTVDGDASAGEGLGQAARDRQLCGLGHAVVNGFGWNLQRRFAGDEDDPAPVARSHAADIVSGQTNATHHIGLKKAQPILIADLLEGLGLENAEVVDQQVDLGQLLDQSLTTLGTAEVGGNAADAGRWELGAQLRQCSIDPRLRPAIEGHLRTLAQQ